MGLKLDIPIYLIKCHHMNILSTDDDEWREECVRWIRARRRIKLGVEWDEKFGTSVTIVSADMKRFERRDNE